METGEHDRVTRKIVSVPSKRPLAYESQMGVQKNRNEKEIAKRSYGEMPFKQRQKRNETWSKKLPKVHALHWKHEDIRVVAPAIHQIRVGTSTTARGPVDQDHARAREVRERARFQRMGALSVGEMRSRSSLSNLLSSR